MQSKNSRAASTTLRAARLGRNFGYRVEGDIVTLNAEIQHRNRDVADCDWRIQLWACPQPFHGGHIDGIKVADVPTGALHDSTTFVEVSTTAQLPADGKHHAMVLVIASQERGNFATIHDYANFPLTQSFILPRMTGIVGYRLHDDKVEIHAQGVENPRAADNLSGTLCLQLWALAERYTGGPFRGTQLASTEIGALSGQSVLSDLAFELPLNKNVSGERYLVLMLREWMVDGYLTRDYACFVNKVMFAATGDARQSQAYNQPVDQSSKTARVLTKVLDTVMPAAKIRVRRTDPVLANEPVVTKEDVLRGRGRGRKLLAKITSVSRRHTTH